MTVAVSTSKVRICHNIFNAVSGRGINEYADTSAVPTCKIGHVLRDVIWRFCICMGWPLSTPLRNGYGTQRYHQVGGPLFWCFFLQPPFRILISDASGNGMGVFCLESGWWWRIDSTEDIRVRLRKRVCPRNDLSMNVFEFLGMAVTAWALTVHAGARPEYPGQSILMRRDMSAVRWVRREQHLGQKALDLTSAVSASSSLEDQLRNRLNAITRQVSGIGASFVG